MRKTEILLAFGGNLPWGKDVPADTIFAAVAALEQRGFELLQMSALYHSEAVTIDAQTYAPEYTNGAARMQCMVAPEQVLTITQEIEQQFGRTPGARWSARTLDIDLLAYGESILPSREAWRTLVASDDPAAILPEPVVPHPRLHLRGFVLAPLLEVVPDWCHPVLGDDIKALVRTARAAGAFEGIKKIGTGLIDRAK